MDEKNIEVEAETLNEAMEQVKTQIPEGMVLLYHQVISDGRPKAVEGRADSVEAAYKSAQANLPQGAVALEKKEITRPAQRTVTVEAFDENSARKQVKANLRHAETIQSIRLTSGGSKGFFGMGKKPNQYEVELRQPAIVSINYKQKAKVAATIGYERGIILLYRAIEKRDMQTIKKLIEGGVNVNDVHGYRPAIIWAINVGEEDALQIVQWLIDKGVDVNKKCEDGTQRTALDWAASGGQLKVVELLLKNGARVNPINGLGMTPLQGAKMQGYSEIVKVLKSYGGQ